jgi:biopolymer transport protein ExbD
MKCLLSVCLTTAICAGATIHSAVLQSTVQARALQARAMQRGVSVEMVSASYAQAWPRADDADAWIVTVDNSGQIYFGIDPMTPEELKQWMIQHPRKRDQKLYIKADARASYASVEKALEAGNAAEFAAPVLLANQQDGLAAPGTVVSPKGWEVAVDGMNRDSQAVVVEVNGSPNETTVTINRETVAWESLPDRLRELAQDNGQKSIQVEANGRATFAQVARVIDACGAVKAKAVLSATTL